jgi:hypothetical protein
VARPSKRTDELTEQIKRSLACGLSFAETAARANITRETLHQWLKDEEFSDEVAGAMAERKFQCIQTILRGKNFFGEAWWLERTDLRWAKPELQWAMQLHQNDPVEKPAIEEALIRSLTNYHTVKQNGQRKEEPKEVSSEAQRIDSEPG